MTNKRRSLFNNPRDQPHASYHKGAAQHQRAQQIDTCMKAGTILHKLDKLMRQG